VRLVVTDDAGPANNGAPLHKFGDALRIENASHFTLKNVEVIWETPLADQWRSAVSAENVQDLTLDGLSARPAHDGEPAIRLNNVDGAVIKNSRALPGTGTFAQAAGASTRDVILLSNDIRAATTGIQCIDGAPSDAVREGF
jgi:hypothetical protein